jgi:cob(I)alamin adenosyltransferase
MKIYTKTGDAGETGLFGGPRVRKCHARVDAYGDVDEANAAIGVARAANMPEHLDTMLERISADLFLLGAELATPGEMKAGSASIGDGHILALEQEIDQLEARLEPLANFILPAGTPAAAALHLARCVTRRAERRVVALGETPAERLSPNVVVYLNRLSDLLFVMAREANRAAGLKDVPWYAPKPSPVASG